jgi:hypothetical protein
MSEISIQIYKAHHRENQYRRINKQPLAEAKQKLKKLRLIKKKMFITIGVIKPIAGGILQI